MDKREFIQFAQSVIEGRLCKIYNVTSIPLKEVEVIVNSVFESLVRAVEMGDEVRFSPLGTFYPFLKKKGDKFVSAQIKFESFKPTEERIFKKLKKLPFLRDKVENNIVVRNVGGDKIYDNVGNELFNLSQIARMAGISPPTAHKYVTKYKDQIETVSNGTGQKYPISVVIFFKQIKQKNMDYSSFREDKPKEEAPKKQQVQGDLLLLSEVSKRAKISVVTLCKYKRKHKNRLGPYMVPSEGGKIYYTNEFVEQCRLLKEKNFSQRQL